MNDHDHGAPGHVHGSGDERAVGIAALLTGTFMVVEVVGGFISGSLALIADAGHMLTDFAALVLAWIAFRLARRPADWKRTYGFDRLSVLAAFVNGLSLFVIAGWIGIEAYRRLQEPIAILGGLMLWVALGGLLVNILAFWVLSRGESDNLNVRAAALHVAGDLLGSIGALLASLIIITTGWTPIDPLLSIAVALIILRSAWRVVRESGHILLEGAPRGFDRREVADAIKAAIPGVTRVHHIHAWSITQERPMATLEAEVAAGTDIQATKSAIKALLRDRFGMEHATVELEEVVRTAGSEG
ncbi:MAG: cation diffusion facilitator family transporter [Alphaproteobacteria bacterium]|nr:cation diffusion facilitator family transporter [Alphaproteobacteria bacterium]